MRVKFRKWLFAIVFVGAGFVPSFLVTQLAHGQQKIKKLSPVLVRVLRGPERYGTWIAESPNGKSILACGLGVRHVYVWERMTWQLRAKWECGDPLWMGPPYPHFARDSWHLRIHSPKEKNPVKHMAMGHVPQPWKVGTDLSKIRYATLSDRTAVLNNGLEVWNGNKKIFRVEDGGSLNEFAVSPDGRFVATVDEDGTLQIWDVDSKKRMHTLATKPWKYQRVLQFSPDSRTVVLTQDSTCLRFYSVQTGKLTKELSLPDLETPGPSFVGVIFSPDEKYLLGQVLIPLPGQGKSEPVRYVAWDAAGRVLGTFDIETLSILTRRQVCFTRDGRYLLVGGNGIEVYSTEFLRKVRSKK